MDITCTHVLRFEQKSLTNLLVSSESYQIYSCENIQCNVKVADSNGMKDNCYGLISLKKYTTGI